MEGVIIFKLLNLMVSINDEERKALGTDTLFDNVRSIIKKDIDYIKIEDKKVCQKQLCSLIKIVADNALDYLVKIQHTNQGMSNYLVNRVGGYPMDGIKTAATLCALGNADMTYDCAEGIESLKAALVETRDVYCQSACNDKDYDALNEMAARLVWLQQLAQIICTFMVSKYGTEMGVAEHFGCNVAEVPTDLAETADSTTEVFDVDDVSGSEELRLLDHYGLLLQGTEAFYAAQPGDQETFAQRYVSGTMMSRGWINHQLSGNEGAIWDKAKLAFSKVFQLVRDGLTAIKENYFDKSLDDMANDLKDDADSNKKALNDVAQKDAVLTDSAKQGIARLAENTGNDNIKSIMGSLSNVGGASAVIDKLMAEFTREYNSASDLQKQFNEVDSDLKALESSANSDTPDDDDKEAMSVKKAAITEKSKDVRSKFDDLKTKLAAQRKNVSAIAKAVRGITPSIFYVEKKEQE